MVPSVGLALSSILSVPFLRAAQALGAHAPLRLRKRTSSDSFADHARTRGRSWRRPRSHPGTPFQAHVIIVPVHAAAHGKWPTTRFAVDSSRLSSPARQNGRTRAPRSASSSAQWSSSLRVHGRLVLLVPDAQHLVALRRFSSVMGAVNQSGNCFKAVAVVALGLELFAVEPRKTGPV